MISSRNYRTYLTRRGTAWSTVALAGLLVVVLGGCASPTVTTLPTAPTPSSSTLPLASPTPGSTVVANAVPTPTPTTTTTVTAGRDWQVLTLPASIPNGDLSAIAVDDHGWIAVGRRSDLAGILVLESVDGRTWKAADPAVFAIGDSSSVTVAAGPEGRVILAAFGTKTTAWHAGSDGRWKKVTFPGSTASIVNQVTWGAGRFLADGVVSPGTPNAHAGFWQSSDGATWRAIASGPPSGGGLTHVAPGFLLAGGVPNGGGGSYSAVWSSTDGSAWSNPRRLPAGDTAMASQVAGGSGGIVIWSDPPGSVIWTSASGTTWTREVVSLVSSVSAVASLGTGFVLAGRATTGDADVFATRASLSTPWQVASTLPNQIIGFVSALLGSPDGSQVLGVGNSGGGRPIVVVSPPG